MNRLLFASLAMGLVAGGMVSTVDATSLISGVSGTATSNGEYDPSEDAPPNPNPPDPESEILVFDDSLLSNFQYNGAGDDGEDNVAGQALVKSSIQSSGNRIEVALLSLTSASAFFYNVEEGSQMAYAGYSISANANLGFTLTEKAKVVYDITIKAGKEEESIPPSYPDYIGTNTSAWILGQNVDASARSCLTDPPAA